MSLANQLGRFLRAALYSNGEAAAEDGGLLAQQAYVVGKVGDRYATRVRTANVNNTSGETQILAAPGAGNAYWILGGVARTARDAELKRGAAGSTTTVFTFPGEHSGDQSGSVVMFPIPLRTEERLVVAGGVGSGNQAAILELFYAEDGDLASV